MNESYFGVVQRTIYTCALRPCHDNTRRATSYPHLALKTLHFKVFSIFVLKIYVVSRNVVVLPGK